jgi:hypothetical protein
MAVTSLVYDIQLIKSAKPTEGEFQLTLGDGRQVRLAASHPYYPLWMIHVESKLRDCYPVGIVTDEAGQVLDLNTAHDTSVAWICELPTDPTRFRVAFWGYSAICGLTQDQPGFDRLRSVLTSAVGTQQRLWVVIHTDETVDDEPDAEGLIAALPKIMDVRPIGCAPGTNGRWGEQVDRSREEDGSMEHDDTTRKTRRSDAMPQTP